MFIIKILNIKSLLITLILLSGLSCGKNQKDTDNFRVAYKGALKNMMHKGDISGKVDLYDFQQEKHFYALGAIENLKGEIQIFDSKPINTFVDQENLTVDNSFNKKATLLVYTWVKEWNSITIPDDIQTVEQLEKFIELTAYENQINIDKPFPFLIEGKVDSVDWHVIDWENGDTEHSLKKHKSSGLHGNEKNVNVEIIGFFSKSHQTIFTHHSSNVHIHMKTVDNKIAGHVDELTLGKGILLKLPKHMN